MSVVAADTSSRDATCKLQSQLSSVWLAVAFLRLKVLTPSDRSFEFWPQRV